MNRGAEELGCRSRAPSPSGRNEKKTTEGGGYAAKVMEVVVKVEGDKYKLYRIQRGRDEEGKRRVSERRRRRRRRRKKRRDCAARDRGIDREGERS